MAVQDHIDKQVDRLLSANSPATLMAARGVLRFNGVPRVVVYGVVLAVLASWIPLTFAVRAKFSKSDQPRVHIFQDMDNQAKYNAQSQNPVFANEMSMRPPITGTVARGQLDADDFLERGYVVTGVNPDGSYAKEFFDGYPDKVQVDAETLTRGKELYARYCYLCHGYDGYGNGPVHVKAASNPNHNPKWVQPSNLHDETRRERPTGHVYNTINIGIRNMAGYGQQIPAPADRWAIVAYVEALQLSQHAPADLLPEGVAAGDVPYAATRLSGAELLMVAEATEEGAPGDEDVLGGTPDDAKTTDPEAAE